MSHLLENREARPRPEPSQARILETLAILVMVALAVAMLYIGREIFIPIAIAIIGSFILSPPILLLRRLGLARRGCRPCSADCCIFGGCRLDPAGFRYGGQFAEISSDDQCQT
jgi:hypothetical protein